MQDDIIDNYREDNESEKEWTYRKNFLQPLFDSFGDKNRLICLSKVYANVEFLKCSYPESVMDEINILVHQIAKMDEKPPIKRIKLKKEKKQDSKLPIDNESIVSMTPTSKYLKTKRPNPKIGKGCVQNELATKSEMECVSSDLNKKASIDWSNINLPNTHFDLFYENNYVRIFKPTYKPQITDFTSYIKGINPKFSLVVYHTVHSIFPILDASLALNKVSFDRKSSVQDRQTFQHSVCMNNKFTWDGIGLSPCEAIENVSIKVLNDLKDISYIIMEKKDPEISSLVTFDKLMLPQAIQEKKQDVHLTGIDDNNMGLKMLKKMGWTGGDVGKSHENSPKTESGKEVLDRLIASQGISSFGQKCHVVAPDILTSNYLNRAKFSQGIHNFLRDYKETRNLDTLVFNQEFTAQERQVIHLTSRRFNFQSKSIGKGESRRLHLRPYSSYMEFLYMVVDQMGIEDANPSPRPQQSSSNTCSTGLTLEEHPHLKILNSGHKNHAVPQSKAATSQSLQKKTINLEDDIIEEKEVKPKKKVKRIKLSKMKIQ